MDRFSREGALPVIENILAPATSSDSWESINCDLSFEPGQIISKRLVFHGSDASNVTVNLNGAKLSGKGTINDGIEMIQVKSRESVVRNTANHISSYQRPASITIKNGKIYGKVRVWGMSRNAEGDGYPFGSSISDRDFDRNNVVMQNQIFKNPSLNSPNFVEHNEPVTDQTVEYNRAAGCYVEQDDRGFMFDGEFFDVYLSAIYTNRRTCRNGDLTSQIIINFVVPKINNTFINSKYS